MRKKEVSMKTATVGEIQKNFARILKEKEVSSWIKANNEALPLTLFHDLEFNRTIQLKRFRAEITGEEAISIASKKE
jgi:hypothetical protein